MQKNCSKCGLAFNCQNETSGCWCEKVYLSKESLDALRRNYQNCLCPACLESFASDTGKLRDKGLERDKAKRQKLGKR